MIGVSSVNSVIVSVFSARLRSKDLWGFFVASFTSLKKKSEQLLSQSCHLYIRFIILNVTINLFVNTSSQLWGCLFDSCVECVNVCMAQHLGCITASCSVSLGKDPYQSCHR